MALVICCVFLTERMRRRMSIRLGIGYASLADCSASEPLLELLSERVFDLRLQRVVDDFLLADR